MNFPHFKTPFALTDSYKLSHWRQFPEDVNYIYSNFTPRYTLLGDDVKHVVVFGVRAFCWKLIDTFEQRFFSLDLNEAINDYVEFFTAFMGVSPNEDDIKRVSDLWGLGELPLEIHCVPEGSFVPHGVPVLTIENTVPGFHWLVGWVESWMSSELWHPMTSATTASMYRIQFDKYANLTSEQDFMPKFQGHDFSFRGQTCLEAATVSGAAHALFFTGSDTCPSISWIMDNYNESMAELPKELIITSVPATEHSVMCAGGEESEIDTISRLLDLHPTGILSVVSDTWDFWGVVTEILPQLKHRIMSRDGKYVVRPDSGDPVKIICGDPDAEAGTPEREGLIALLGSIFGYTFNSKGYKQLDPHIGAIYGDSITLARQKAILEGLEKKGWSSTNIVLGIGSFTYQYVTRDTHGFAMKATAVGKVDGTYMPIFKAPKTDSGKNSAKGFLSVYMDPNACAWKCQQNVPFEQRHGQMGCILRNGEVLEEETFEDIRKRAEIWLADAVDEA